MNANSILNKRPCRIQCGIIAIATLVTTLLPLSLYAAEPNTLISPNGRISVKLNISRGQFGYTVNIDNQTVYTLSDISLQIGQEKLPSGTAKVGKTIHVQNSFKPVVPLKFSTINEDYNETSIKISTGVNILIRVMNNGVAYRFVLARKGDVEVYDETFRLTPADGFLAHRQTAPDNFNTSFEERYRHEKITEWASSDRKMTTLPLLLSGDKDTQLLIGQSDLDDYPHQFVNEEEGTIVPRYPKSPIKWEPRGDRSEVITEEATYIAKIAGKRALPWRWILVTNSKGLIEQTLPAQLSRRSALADASWIKPGQFSWEWWNGAAPYGPDVNFRYGCNYDTYCYFADFAARYGVDYILLDEGWAKSTHDPFHGNDNLRLHDLIKYCKAKAVGIVLWLPWLTVEQNLDTLFKTYAEWGIPAVKIDFMDHADQWMVNFYKRVVQEAAKYKIIVDFHGAFTPAGLEYEYPNLISYEGILGLEQMGGCSPDNTLYLPYIRNAVGAADFTPGGMNNMQPTQYSAQRPNSGAQGTRAFQMALYVILESGVQMLADNPTRYYQNEDCTRYITSVPTTWDETRAIEAKVGEYVIVAKRKGAKWFIGGITNGTARDFRLKLDFLSDGQHKMIAFKDGVNADYQAMHYNKIELDVSRDSIIDIHMVQNGGWAAAIE